MTMKEKTKKKQKLSFKERFFKTTKQKIVVSCISVAVITLTAFVIITLTKDKTPKIQDTPDGRGILVSEDNVERVVDQMKSAVPPGNYDVCMNCDWNFKTSSSNSENAYVKNADANQNTVYFDVNLSKTGECVYSSPYMPVGTSLKQFALTKKLKKGDYDAVVKYHLVNDDFKELSTVAINIKLHIAK